MHRVFVWGLVLLVPLPALWSQEQETSADKEVKIEGKLSPDDPKDKKLGKGPHKVHEIKMKAGKVYQIDLVSKDFDSFLRLEDSTGKQLAQDDDSGGFPNARITFKAPKDGTYRIIATSFDGKAGAYTLTAKEASKASLAATEAYNAAIREFQTSYFPASQKLKKDYDEAKTEAEREKLFEKFTDIVGKSQKRFEKIAKDFPGETSGKQAAKAAKQLTLMAGQVKGQIVSSAGNTLRAEYEKAFEAKAGNADELYKKAEAYYGERIKRYAKDAAVAKELEDGLFLLQKLSIGKAAPEIEGEDLEGKKFKLSDYRGKVVVLDFWGNW